MYSFHVIRNQIHEIKIITTNSQQLLSSKTCDTVELTFNDLFLFVISLFTSFKYNFPVLNVNLSLSCAITVEYLLCEYYFLLT